MKAKVILLLCVLLGLVPITGVAWYSWDSHRNHGLRFGYWADFNRVKRVLDEIPGVVIKSDFYNGDVTLEEFGFRVTIDTGEERFLFFSETDPVRDMSGARLTHALTEKIWGALK